jgi:hypothetical protein
MSAKVQSILFRYLDIGNAAHTLEQLLLEPDKIIKENKIFEGQGNLRIAALLLYMFEFDGFVNYALIEATGNSDTYKQKLTLKERIKKIYVTRTGKNDVLGQKIFQEIGDLYHSRDALVRPKVVSDEFVDETVACPVSSEKLGEYMSGELSEFSEVESFNRNKKLLEDATRKIAQECNIPLYATSSVQVRSY